MKKHLNLYTASRFILLIETVLCVVTGLCVLMVNGVDSFSTDHLVSLVLVGITLTSHQFLKSQSLRLNRAALWLGGVPFLLISYDLVALLFPYHPHTEAIL